MKWMGRHEAMAAYACVSLLCASCAAPAGSAGTGERECVRASDCPAGALCGSDGRCQTAVNDAGPDVAPTAEPVYLPEGEGDPIPAGAGGGGPITLPTNDCVVLPLSAYAITGYRFGTPVAGWGLHLGEDVDGNAGDIVVAPFRGEVIYATNHPPRRDSNGNLRGNWGGLVLLRAVGLTPVVVWLGGHLDPTDLPRVGQIVDRGARLGRLARQDQIGFGEHLHSQLATGDVAAMVQPGYAATTRGWQAFSVWAQSVAAMCRREPVTPTCPTGQVACSGSCVDVTGDARHCGSCGVTCPSDQACIGGRCTPTCPAPRRQCLAGCVDVFSDPSNCGACGARCSATRATTACTAGRCTLTSCASGYGDCDQNAVNGCEASLAVDASNCGACGRSCLAGQRCSAGACAWVCATGTTWCKDACVDTRTRVDHCGGCGRTCTAPTGGSVACVGGVCQPACPPGRVACGARCVDVASDSTNCGACGATCGAGGSCVASRCVTPVCNDYLRITSPGSGVSARVGTSLAVSFVAPGCPATTLFEIRARRCCVSGDCMTGYDRGDPDAACPSTLSASFTGTSYSVPLTSFFTAGWYRTAVRPVGLDGWASPFIRVRVY